MFEFYNTFYRFGLLPKDEVHEAASWGVISLYDYERITGEEYLPG